MTGKSVSPRYLPPLCTCCNMAQVTIAVTREKRELTRGGRGRERSVVLPHREGNGTYLTAPGIVKCMVAFLPGALNLQRCHN